MKTLLRRSALAALVATTVTLMSASVTPAVGHAQQPLAHPHIHPYTLYQKGWQCATAPDGSGRFCASLGVDDHNTGYPSIYGLASQGGSPITGSYSVQVQLYQYGSGQSFYSNWGPFNQQIEFGPLGGCYSYLATVTILEYLGGTSPQQAQVQASGAACT